jgi:superfamily II DNA or RNA helicase
MGKVVDEVLKVGSWAEIKLLPGAGDEARQRLTLTIKDTGVQLAQYRNHPTDPTKLFIPRGLVTNSGILIEGDWPKIDTKSRMSTPRSGQLDTINTYLSGISSKYPYGGILQAVTGAGKTVMALDIACAIGLSCLIVVPRSSLVDQWRKQIVKWTTCSEDDIGLIQGSTRDYKNKKFTLAMIHTLSQQYENYELELFSSFGTVIFDECHVVGAETFSLTAPLFRSKYRIGLSATPRRADGMDNVFYWHIGPILAKFTKLQAEARVRILNYNGSDTTHSGCVYGGKLSLGRYFNRVAKSSGRMNLLARIVKTLDEKGHDILVLSDRINHLQWLKNEIVARGVNEDEIGFLIGNKKELTKRIILGTYGSAGMGVDIPRLTALVLATPRADIEQAVGRVLRQGTPIVVDIVDTASSIMKGWAAKRAKYFERITRNIQRGS